MIQWSYTARDGVLDFSLVYEQYNALIGIGEVLVWRKDCPSFRLMKYHVMYLLYFHLERNSNIVPSCGTIRVSSRYKELTRVGKLRVHCARPPVCSQEKERTLVLCILYGEKRRKKQALILLLRIYFTHCANMCSSSLTVSCLFSSLHSHKA